MRVDILTIFPEFFTSSLQYGVLSRAIREQRVTIRTSDLRDFTSDRHRTVDDRPFGGGEGMVLKPEPIGAALTALEITPKPLRDPEQETILLLSAQGRRFNQQVAQELSTVDRLVMVCGRYEGVDERVNTVFCDRELSIGDYVLSGGELAAAVILDAVIRLLPGVLGNADSSRNESFAKDTTPRSLPAPTQTAFPSEGLLDYPHYTRPAIYQGHRVPEALSGGDHAAIRQWRRRMSLQKTFENRPDLLHSVNLDLHDLAFLATLGWIRTR